MMDIKPCPLCGSEARLRRGEEGWYVGCTGFSCLNNWAPEEGCWETQEEAIDEWNELAEAGWDL